ncbi:MAG: hypothetical protein PWQ50_1388 [Methanolobus sp.]|nr:hypothetical protein [Methanolobus sp.]
MKDTWEKVFEYASSPEQFVRITEDENSQKINTYYDWEKIESVRTYSKGE